MSRKKYIIENQQPLINLDDILEMLYYDNQFARCWTCKKEYNVSSLKLKMNNQIWSIICKRCHRNNYFSS